jgi:hypothetical protein
MANEPTTYQADTPLIERPSEITYDHLQPGDVGYWPFICGVPDDVEVGDRVSFKGDVIGDVVTSVRTNGVQVTYTTTGGHTYNIGRMARGFRLDRWGTHSDLSNRGAR